MTGLISREIRLVSHPNGMPTAYKGKNVGKMVVRLEK
jgi:hypothetical protein